MSSSTPASKPRSGATQKERPIDKLINIFEIESNLDDEGVQRSGTDVARDVIDAMLNAETFDQALEISQSGLDSGKTLVGVEMNITSYITRPTSMKGSLLKHYFEITATRLDTGEIVTFACGAPNVMVPLFKARSNNELPVEVVIRARETANGELLYLERISKRAVASEVV